MAQIVFSGKTQNSHAGLLLRREQENEKQEAKQLPLEGRTGNGKG